MKKLKTILTEGLELKPIKSTIYKETPFTIYFSEISGGYIQMVSIDRANYTSKVVLDAIEKWITPKLRGEKIMRNSGALYVKKSETLDLDKLWNLVHNAVVGGIHIK